jgi:hypothetical protein
MSRLRCVGAVILASILVASCGGGGGGDSTGGGPSPTPTTYTASSGVAQKGPFVKGSTVTAQELDRSLAPTGKQYSYQVSSDLGAFAPDAKFTTAYIGVSATGNYFDEVANTTSAASITLTGISDLSSDPVLNVNVLTTLEYMRIQALVKSGKAFAAARSQAESEVLAAFNIHTPTAFGPFGTLDLSKSRDGDKILATVSSLLAYGNTPENLKAVMASVQADIAANGAITNPAIRATLAASARALNPAAVAANLNSKYASVGLALTAADISGWLDQTGDGVIGKFQFEVAGATQTSSFTFPTSVTDPYAGTSISVSAGQFVINGSAATGAVTLKSGDTVVVKPPSGAFPNGVLTSYLLSGGSKIAAVSFISGLSSIALTPANPSLPAGSTQQLKATGTFTDGSTSDVTNSVQWSSSTPAVATVDATSGLVSAVAPGQATITAISGTTSGSTVVSVPAVSLKSIAITPTPFTTGVGIARQMTATGTYSDGSTANLTSLATWSTGSPAIATVTGGSVSGVAAGSTTVTAAIGAVSVNATLTVTSHTWNTAGSMQSGRSSATATLLPGGSILVAGGYVYDTVAQSGGVTASSEIYDPVADKWSSAGNMIVGREEHTATLLPNGKVLVVGGTIPDGHGSQFSQASAEIYDPAANKWSSAGSMKDARQDHTATLLPDGKVLVVGGLLWGSSGLSTADPGTEIYDPATNTWASAANPVAPRAEHTATLLPNGKVLVVAGFGFSASSRVATAEIYDPNSNTWSPAATLADGRRFHNATRLQNGKVMVSGGETDSFTGSAEIYDPAANTWSKAGSLGPQRYPSQVALLPNGTVLVVGGYAGTDQYPQASTMIYDPVSATWSPGASMAVGRTDFTATVLQNGAVLVTAPSGLTGCELYW